MFNISAQTACYALKKYRQGVTSYEAGTIHADIIAYHYLKHAYPFAIIVHRHTILVPPSHGNEREYLYSSHADTAVNHTYGGHLMTR